MLKLFSNPNHLTYKNHIAILSLNTYMKPNSLIEEAQKGDKKAFNELVNQWYSRIYNFAFKYFAEHDQASEVAQKTFISVYKNLSKLKESNSFRPWIYQIASNHCHDELRKKQKKWTISFFKSSESNESNLSELHEKSTDKGIDPEYQLGQSELSELLQKALKLISEEQRIVLILKEYEGLKFHEIAEALNISENTAKSRLYYGLKHLKNIFEKWNIKQENIYYEL